jgi:hypothetical protein
MTKKDESGIGDFEDAFRSIPHASGLRLLLAIVAQRNTHTDHVDISQAFTQGEILDGDGQNGKVYIQEPPAILKTYSTATSLNGLFTACRALPVLGLRSCSKKS